ncbi:unnamed protein product [marine sediment metagenome]|uniref:2Fe-2S ferredoxin-type domain-containing protein n=1 Tax=marine sediment metagenome TaxID=412755 RepID=X1PFB2_9ZZZZ
MARVWINGERWVDVEDAEGVNVVHFTVDDKEIAVSGGQTILETVARMPGIGNIPALCYHPAVKPYGACRICTVEVSEDGGSTLDTHTLVERVGFPFFSTNGTRGTCP